MTYSCKGGKSQKSVMHVPGCCFANVPEWAGLTGCARISSWLTPRAVHTLHARREYKLFSRGNSWHHRSAYGVRSRTKSILRFRGLGNTSSLRKLFFESLSVVFVASVPCLRVVASLVSSYCFLRGTAGFSSWRRYGLMSSLRHFYVFVSSGLPFVDWATYLGRYLIWGDIYCTNFTRIRFTVSFLLGTLYIVTL